MTAPIIRRPLRAADMIETTVSHYRIIEKLGGCGIWLRPDRQRPMMRFPSTIGAVIYTQYNFCAAQLIAVQDHAIKAPRSKEETFCIENSKLGSSFVLMNHTPRTRCSRTFPDVPVLSTIDQTTSDSFLRLSDGLLRVER